MEFRLCLSVQGGCVNGMPHKDTLDNFAYTCVLCILSRAPFNISTSLARCTSSIHRKVSLYETTKYINIEAAARIINLAQFFFILLPHPHPGTKTSLKLNGVEFLSPAKHCLKGRLCYKMFCTLTPCFLVPSCCPHSGCCMTYLI
jgi:hypothetical protein